MNAKPKEYALVITDLEDGKTKLEKVEVHVDRTHRPMRPELRKQIEAKYGKDYFKKGKRKK